jgi:hypothetical protein
MVLIIFLTNFLIRKIRGMMKITQIKKKHIKANEPQMKFSRKDYAPKKTSPHEMKMKLVTVRQKEFNLWQ